VPFFASDLPLPETDLSFTRLEPGDGQRWSTWPSIIPTQRGPEPRPAWVVTSAGAFDTELGIVKTGKEADVFLVERAEPGHPGAVMAAKRYRGADVRDFHRSSQYEEGRRTRRSRDSRAMANKSSYGRAIAADHWSFAEFDALCTLYELGAPVPYPVQVNGTELLMEFIGDGRTAAPRLAQVSPTRDHLDQVVALMHLLARAGFAHGDLSAYNLLVHSGRVVVIDLPQVVDAVSNPNGLDLLHRDCVNVATWFARQRVPVDAEELFADLLGELY
jgi:RIO kinase 1